MCVSFSSIPTPFGSPARPPAPPQASLSPVPPASLYLGKVAEGWDRVRELFYLFPSPSFPARIFGHS